MTALGARLAARIRQLDPQHPNPDLWGEQLAEVVDHELDMADVALADALEDAARLAAKLRVMAEHPNRARS